MTLYLRPDADDLDGAWTNESGSNASLFASLDETSASDTDYIQSPLNPSAETCRIGLSNPTGGTPAEPFTLSYRFNNLGGTQLTVRLLQGTTPIASWNETGTGWTTSNRTLTSLQFAAISDFTNLFVELSASGLGGDPTLKLDLDFTAMAGTLDSRVTFARASAATYFNSSGVLTSASSGAPRFDYNPVNLAARGLLLEQQRTNNVARSQEINDGAWAKGNWTVTANAIVAPDGTTTADKLVETTATANRYLFNGTPAFATSGARTVTGAWYLKAAERTWCLCVVEGAGQSFGYYINLGTGTIGSAGGSAASDKVSITDVGGGWYRVTVSKTISFSTNDGYATVYGALADGGTSTYAGVLGSGFYVWGVQLEEGAFATSYIPTTTAAVTRAADQAEITGTNFSSWYNQDEGAFVTEFTIPNVDYWYIWTVSNFEWYSYNEFFRHGPNGVNGNAEMAVFASGGQVAALSVTPVIVANVPHSTAFAYKINDFALCSNGGTIGPDTGGGVPTMSRMDLGSHLGNKSPIHFARLRYYNVRKTDAELRDLTGPSLDLDFTAGVLDSRVTFARASAATCVNSAGLITNVASGAPRFDYAPVTLAARGLLIEEQRTNLLLRSQELNTAASWGGTGIVTADAIAAPDGTTTADYLVSTGNSYISQSTGTGLTNGLASTLSFYAKKGTVNFIRVNYYVGTDSQNYFNLNTGTVASVGASATCSIENIGNGWYRCSVTRTQTSTGYYLEFGPAAASGSASSSAGDSIYGWGIQVEQGAFATSYIPTTTAAVTRAADSASMTGTNFSSWFNQTTGTLVMAFTGPLAVSSASKYTWGLSDGGSNFVGSRHFSGGQPQVFWSDGFNEFGNVPTSKTGVAYAASDRALCFDGGTVTASAAAYTPPAYSRLDFGDILGGGYHAEGMWLKRATFYTSRKTNTELQALTT